MKIYISVDMEGITGVTHSRQCSPDHPEYGRFRRLMTQDVNAAIEGALAEGATEFLVNDAHGPMTNVLIEELHPKARLLQGANKHLGQMEGIDGTFAAVFFVGYHAREGRDDGVINHTLMGRTVYEIRLDGDPLDEAAINAGIAGHFGVPIALLTGDDAVTQDARRRFPGVTVAQVKTSINRFTAACLSVEESQALIREKAGEAAKKIRDLKPYLPQPPYRFEVDFKSTSSAHMALLIPGVERKGGRTVTFEKENYLEAFKVLWAVLILGNASREGIL